MSVSVNIPGLTPPGAKKAAQQANKLEDIVQETVQSRGIVPTNTVRVQSTRDNPIKVMVGTPAYGGLCHVGYTQSLINDLLHLAQHGVGVTPCFLSNESLIPRGRNTVVAKFLADKSCTHLLFIDADITWAAGTIWRLLNHDKDIVGALYPKKGYDWQRLIRNPEVLEIITRAKEQNRDLTTQETSMIRAKLMSFVVNMEPGQTSVRDGLMAVKHLGTGFMLIKRHVFEKMSAANPDLKYDDDIGVLNSQEENDNLWAFFNTEVHKLSVKRHFLSEDYLFCMRWKEMGGDIWADITIPLTHTGTHSFAGNFAVGHNFKARRVEPSTVTEAVSNADDEKPAPSIDIQREQPVTPRNISSLSEATSVIPSEKPKKLSPLDVGKINIK